MRKTDDQEILRMLQDGRTQKEIAEHFGVSPVAVCKRLKRLLPQPAEVLDKHKLTDQQKKFVIEKATGKTSTDAVLASYEVSSRESAKALGSQLMDKPEIQLAISELMQHHGLTRSYRIQKLKKHVDHPDPNVSLKGIDLANRMDATYSTPPLINIDLSTPRALSKEIQELERQIAELEAEHPELREIEGGGN